ncbi:MAG: hypothetical protein KGK03_04745 [Candidatus Omnitrophica bacterium]|nr:hypothetical protein [Candidatus Omnitrophota bacterium]MDE2222361.1 hypothetical protein [Candidatus Omnitrophota bacterium]
MLSKVLKVVFAAVLLYLVIEFVAVPLIREHAGQAVKTSPAQAQPLPDPLPDMGASGILNFMPGQAALTVSEQQKLFTLMGDLQGHPSLVLKIAGSYDPQLDKGALLEEMFDRRFENLNQKSSPEKTYQWMYRRRFGLRALWALSKKYKKGWGRYDYAKLNAEIKRRLVADMSLDQGVLKTLARARAQLIYKFLAVNGFDARHMELGEPRSIQASAGQVPLPLTLIVFDRQ